MANELEQKARELLIAAYTRAGCFGAADKLSRTPYVSGCEEIALRAIVAALQQAQQPGAQAVESSFLGWVRRAAIEKLRTDDEVTGVMVHAEEQTDSVKVYTAPPPLPEGVSEECETLLRSAMDVAIEVVKRGQHAASNAANLRNRIDAFLQRLAAKGGV